jgi:hypothetical protein
MSQVFSNHSKDLPTTEDIARIRGLQHACIRNLQITQCYFELSKALLSRIGTNANWCTFATWASKQAGVSIRGEDLERLLENSLKTEKQITRGLEEISYYIKTLGSKSRHEQVHQELLDAIVKGVTARVSDAVARGNKKVFEEIGYEFARFMGTCMDDAIYREETIQNFCKPLRNGDPPEGQDYLKRAFCRYYQSFFESNDKKRQELLLLANIEIGFHEQTRLQPEIGESLRAALVDPGHVKLFVRDVLLTNLGFVGSLIYLISWLRGKKSLLYKAIDQLVIVAQPLLSRLLTAEMMTLTIPPDRCLRLGNDLAASFPTDLQHLENEELLTLLSRIDPSADSLEQTGATDWSDLQERLHYIADLFRCFHKDHELFSEAFSPAQVAALKIGNMPEGRL